MFFDSLLGFTAYQLSGSRTQRTAFLHVDYRNIARIERDLRVDARLDGVEGRKIYVSGRLLDGDTVLAEARALFVKLKPGQP
jgi:acyl-CoA thioesterase FadM